MAYAIADVLDLVQQIRGHQALLAMVFDQPAKAHIPNPSAPAAVRTNSQGTTPAFPRVPLEST
jgi:hypothetical protein